MFKVKLVIRAHKLIFTADNNILSNIFNNIQHRILSILYCMKWLLIHPMQGRKVMFLYYYE